MIPRPPCSVSSTSIHSMNIRAGIWTGDSIEQQAESGYSLGSLFPIPHLLVSMSYSSSFSNNGDEQYEQTDAQVRGGGGKIRGNNQFRQIFGIRGTRSTPRKLCGCLACPILVLLLTNGNAARQANTPTLLGNLLLALLTETIRTIAHERLY
jgi:hypothetical protein